MIKLVEKTYGEFVDSQKSYDFVIGEKESYSDFYEFTCDYRGKEFLVGLIHNPSMGLKPQIEILSNKLIVGIFEGLTIINLETKEIYKFPFMPLNMFFIRGDKIIVISELEVLCIVEEKIKWHTSSGNDMFFFSRFEGEDLIMETYEDKREVRIDTDTGKKK